MAGSRSAAEQNLLARNVGTFDLSVYWLANSNLNEFELDLIFLSTDIYLK